MKAKLFFGILYSDKELLRKITEKLEKRFGEIEKQSFSYNFERFTKYYNKEMGSNLKKKFLIFKNKITKDRLANIKTQSNKLENEFKIKNKRKIDLDPGYLTTSELILASSKASPYKTEIAKGVYSHKTLKFNKKQNCFEELPRTFPDFRWNKLKEFFLEIRNKI